MWTIDITTTLISDGGLILTLVSYLGVFGVCVSEHNELFCVVLFYLQKHVTLWNDIFNLYCSSILYCFLTLIICYYRIAKYRITSLEKLHKPQLYVEPDLGIPLDLLDLSVYKYCLDSLIILISQLITQSLIRSSIITPFLPD